MGKGARPSQAEKESISSPKHCQACGTAVKDHLGPHGPQRCLVGLVGALRERIDALEQQSARHDEQLRREQYTLSAKMLYLRRLTSLRSVLLILRKRLPVPPRLILPLSSAHPLRTLPTSLSRPRTHAEALMTV